uniref:Uncharacterized protein MANES_17G098400 n=1 Tax=Rhizophora mucronata TaxID=61149 RepID=A0A2P2QED0_RHIMU
MQQPFSLFIFFLCLTQWLPILRLGIGPLYLLSCFCHSKDLLKTPFFCLFIFRRRIVVVVADSVATCFVDAVADL